MEITTRVPLNMPPTLNGKALFRWPKCSANPLVCPCWLQTMPTLQRLEKWCGAARKMKDFIVITLGTGLGSGFVSNGQLINGKHGIAGELGHTTVNYAGRYCNCGKRGCLETYVSATGIKRSVYKLLADHLEPSELRGISFDNLNTKMITEAAIRGDVVAREAFNYTGRILERSWLKPLCTPIRKPYFSLVGYRLQAT